MIGIVLNLCPIYKQKPHLAAGFFFIVFYKITRLELVAKGKAEHIALAVGVAHRDRTGLRIGRAV